MKAQTCSLVFCVHGLHYVLNLIDTPGRCSASAGPPSSSGAKETLCFASLSLRCAGHVDFSFEVDRGLAASDGVVWLVDVSQGPQAQSLAVLNRARQLGVKVLPVVSKVRRGGAAVCGLRASFAETLQEDGVRHWWLSKARLGFFRSTWQPRLRKSRQSLNRPRS